MTSRWNIGLLTPAALFVLTSCAAPVRSDTPPPESAKPAPAETRAEIATVTLEEFFQLQESGMALIIDARPSFVYQFGRVPGAINIPKGRCDEAIAKQGAEFRRAIAAGRTLVVYCTGLNCPDARTVADHLATAGISASVFAGGWDAWREAGMPVE